MARSARDAVADELLGIAAVAIAAGLMVDTLIDGLRRSGVISEPELTAPIGEAKAAAQRQSGGPNPKLAQLIEREVDLYLIGLETPPASSRH